MWISRVRVTGGFLSGLDVELTRGLNVIVGPRGVGKTTLLELIRHALAIPNPIAQKRSNETRVRELLRDGEIVIDIESDRSRHRLAVDAEGRGRSSFTESVALMLGQNELESIASDKSSRLQLIDLRAGVHIDKLLLEDCASLTKEIANLKENIQQSDDQLAQRRDLALEREGLVAEETQLLSAATNDLSALRHRLRTLEDELGQVEKDQERAERASTLLTTTNSLHQSLARQLTDLRQISTGSVLAPLLDDYIEQEAEYLHLAESTAAIASQQIVEAVTDLAARDNNLRVDAARLRADLEEAETGLGDVTARLRNVEVLLAKLEVLAIQISDMRDREVRLRIERDARFDARDAWQEEVFSKRDAVARHVSSQLDNRVVVTIDHLADTMSLRAALQALLQGSNLQYRPLADAISRDVLPRQLLRLVESGNVKGLATASRIAEERAARVISHLQTPEALGELAQLVLEDYVDFQLQDGLLTKSVEELSAGQKCAVTLPIFLTEESRALILDQPEDHLDNAYLVSHVIKSMQRRGESGAQTIVATHNANIPVLGGAETVIALQSDGLRGFVDARGGFDQPDIVQIITSLMEGGAEAFKRRANFYRQFGSLDGGD